MVCSICRMHSPSSGQIGRTSMAMLCQEASKSLCPSSKLAIPDLPLHGRSFKKGVRFSVQTTSWGRTPYKSWRLDALDFSRSPSGWNDMTGRVVRVLSMKLSEAQKRPDSALVSVSHFLSALLPSSQLYVMKAGVNGTSYSSSVSASNQAHSSTPVPPSRAPFQGLAPQFSASHLPRLNLRCSSRVPACSRI